MAHEKYLKSGMGKLKTKRNFNILKKFLDIIILIANTNYYFVP